jgi:cyclase
VIKKRLAGVVTVRRGWAVQSFGYDHYLPLGKPEVLVQNLDRWGADEIFLQCIDRANVGPDFELLDRVSRLGLSTPLIYAGGIRSVEDGVRAVQVGADRVCVDALLHDDLSTALALADPLGAQAVIAALPLTCKAGDLLWHDYRNSSDAPFSPELLSALRTGRISEALVIDWRHEGTPGMFDATLVSAFPVSEVPLIAFGGLSEAAQARDLLERPNVAAVAVGNFLNYREHAVQQLKARLGGLPLRPPFYEKSTWN